MARTGDPNARARLLEAAERVFADKGLDRAKVEDITSQAGLSKGAFYLHFDSKEQAFRELVTVTIEQLGHFIARYDTCGQVLTLRGVRAFLDEWLDMDQAVFEFIWNNRGVMLLTLEGGCSAEYQHLVEHFAMRAQSNMQSNIEQGIALGLYRKDIKPALTAAFIAGGYDRFARQLVKEKKKPDLIPALRELQLMVLRSIGLPAVIHEAEKPPSKPAPAIPD